MVDCGKVKQELTPKTYFHWQQAFFHSILKNITWFQIQTVPYCYRCSLVSLRLPQYSRGHPIPWISMCWGGADKLGHLPNMLGQTFSVNCTYQMKLRYYFFCQSLAQLMGKQFWYLKNEVYDFHCIQMMFLHKTCFADDLSFHPGDWPWLQCSSRRISLCLNC